MESKKKYSMTALWEMNYPIIVSIIFLICFLFFGNKLKFNFIGLVEVSMSLFGILIGFLITVLTIINSLDNQYMRAIKENIETFNLFKSYLINAIWLSFFTLIIGVLYIFIFSSCFFPIKDIFEIIIFFITSWALISCYRFISSFVKIAI